MKCVACDSTTTVISQPSAFCKSCFIKAMIKRVKKGLQQSLDLAKGITLINDQSVQSMVSHQMLQEIFGKTPLILKINKSNYRVGKTFKSATIVPWSMDQEEAYFLRCIMHGEKATFIGNYDHCIKMLLPLTMKEIELYAKLLDIKCKHINYSSPEQTLLDTLEQTYPDIKHSFFKTIQKLQKPK